MRLKLVALERAVAFAPEAAQLAAELRADLDRALSDLRDLARGIYPAALESDGLRGALTEAVSRTAITATVEFDGTGRYSRGLEAAVYFCCVEALQNAAKHAGAGARACLHVSESNDALLFEVADDGAGFDTACTPGGAGIQNMTDRISALGGTLQIRAAPGAGTNVAGAVPLRGPGAVIAELDQ
jgi:signal transduction histidine kinase